MSMNDPIADLLTRIRNASAVSKKWVDVKCSNVNIRILYILKEEYFIRDYVKIQDNKQGILRVYLKYSYNDQPVIRGLKRVSTPGCREYVSVDNMPRVLNGMGISIVSTSKGVMSNKKAKNLNIGGEILCQVW